MTQQIIGFVEGGEMFKTVTVGHNIFIAFKKYAAEKRRNPVILATEMFEEIGKTAVEYSIFLYLQENGSHIESVKEKLLLYEESITKQPTQVS
jgi:hypothetical protein